MAKIKQLTDKHGEIVYPVSKEAAIYDENGALLSDKISTFITRLVDNLANYYLKSELYTKEEIDTLIGAIQGFSYIVVSELPIASAFTMGTIYLVPSEDPQTQNIKDEYITIRSGSIGSYTYSWEQIGSTAIDLSGYVTTNALNAELAKYTTTANLTALLAGKQNTISDLSTIRSGAAAGAAAYQKPSAGIPGNDLNAETQHSLELANSAVQAEHIGSIIPPVNPSEFATKDDIDELNSELNGTIENKDITPTMALGYYYTVSGTTISVTSSGTSKYSGDASTTPPTGGVDISSYVGKTLKVTASGIGTTPSRCCAMLNESNSVVKSWKENEFTEDGDKYSYSAVIPSTAKWFFLSGGGSFVLESVVILAEVVVEGISTKVDTLAAAMDSLSNKRVISLSGLTPASPYINVTENVWKTSTTTKSVIVEIMPGHTYCIVSNANLPARYVFLASTTKGDAGDSPDYAASESEVHILPCANSSVTVTAPYNAAGLYLLGTLEGNNTMPQALYEVIDKNTVLQEEIDATKKRVFTYSLTLGKRIDLRDPTSANFGKVVNATNEDWGVSQLFDVGNAKEIRYYANTLSSSTNYGGWTGACFYDESGNPLTTGYRLITVGDRSYSQWINQEVPAGAKYFRVCVGASLDGSSDKNVRLFGLKTEDVFGVEDASDYPHQYYGEKVRFDNLYSLTIPAASAYAGQSAAIYGKYLFIVSNHLTNMVLFDMERKVVLYNLTTGFVEDGDWHCNQSSFGIYKYDEADMFPLLYISQRNNSEGRGVIQGYRIIPTLTDGEISSFTMSLTQTIYLPIMTDVNCLGNPNVTFDTERNRMWAYSRNNNEEADNYNKARFTMFDIPPLYDNGTLVSEVVLNDSDIFDAFSDEWNMYNAQGGTIRNGKLVILQGYPNAGYIYCRVIDLYAQKKQVSFFDLLSDGLEKEPEGVFFYDNAIHFTSASKNIYRINLY